MNANDLRKYIATTDPSMTLAEAWNDFADSYGWDREDNPYTTDDDDNGYPADDPEVDQMGVPYAEEHRTRTTWSDLTPEQRAAVKAAAPDRARRMQDADSAQWAARLESD